MSKLQIVKKSKSLISSQLLSKFNASDISVQVKPLDLVCTSLVLLSLVKLAAVSISIKQSSICVESLPQEVCYILKQGTCKSGFLLCSA